MVIRNPEILAKIASGVPLKLDLGAGRAPRKGFYSVDIASLDGLDISADLSHPFDKLPDSCTSHIFSSHTLEHIPNLLGLMEEINRIITPSGEINIIVPHFSNTFGYSDPTHLRVFGVYSMYYFSDHQYQPERKVPSYYSKARFRLMKIRIVFYRYSLFDRFISRFLEPTINRSLTTQIFYERRLSWLFHAREIHFSMVPVK